MGRKNTSQSLSYVLGPDSLETKSIPHLDALADEADVIGAVNTVVNDNGCLVGYNTDGKGFMMGGIRMAGQKVVMLGSGGVARTMGVELPRRNW